MDAISANSAVRGFVSGNLFQGSGATIFESSESVSTVRAQLEPFTAEAAEVAANTHWL
jgi:hypothetical protein